MHWKTPPCHGARGNRSFRTRRDTSSEFKNFAGVTKVGASRETNRSTPLRTFGPARSLLQCPDFPELPVEAVRAGPDIFAALECSHFR